MCPIRVVCPVDEAGSRWIVGKQESVQARGSLGRRPRGLCRRWSERGDIVGHKAYWVLIRA